MTQQNEVLGTARLCQEMKLFADGVETYGIDAAASIYANSRHGKAAGKPAEFWKNVFEGVRIIHRGGMDFAAAEREAHSAVVEPADKVLERMMSPRTEVQDADSETIE